MDQQFTAAILHLVFAEVALQKHDAFDGLHGQQIQRHDSAIECAHCGETVGSYYVTCPYCGYRLVDAKQAVMMGLSW